MFGQLERGELISLLQEVDNGLVDSGGRGPQDDEDDKQRAHTETAPGMLRMACTSSC